MSKSLKDAFVEFTSQFISILPMDDAIFFAELYKNNLFPGDTRDSVRAKPTKASMATEFLEKCIEPSFSTDDDDKESNQELECLLEIMEKSDFRSLKDLAKQFRKAIGIDQTTVSSKADSSVSGINLNNLSVSDASGMNDSLNSKPRFPELQIRFREVAEWQQVCPHLIEDESGERTELIRRKHRDIEDQRDEMLRTFLKEKDNPTWNDVVEALELGRYTNLAKKIKKDKQGK